MIPKGLDAWRVVNDYRLLNEITVKDNYLSPNSNSCFNLLGVANYYGFLNMTGAYWHISLDEKSREKSAFSTLTGFIIV